MKSLFTRRRIENKRLGEILIESGTITPDQLNEALMVQKDNDGDKHTPIGDILVGLGYADEEGIFRAFTSQYQFPYLPLKDYYFDPEVISIISLEIIRKHRVIPVDKIRNNLTIATSNPLDKQASDEIKDISKCNKILPFIAPPSEIRSLIDRLSNISSKKL